MGQDKDTAAGAFPRDGQPKERQITGVKFISAHPPFQHQRLIIPPVT
jgi:hypothetical protein